MIPYSPADAMPVDRILEKLRGMEKLGGVDIDTVPPEVAEFFLSMTQSGGGRAALDWLADRTLRYWPAAEQTMEAQATLAIRHQAFREVFGAIGHAADLGQRRAASQNPR